MGTSSTSATVRRTERTTLTLLVGVFIIDYIDRVMIAVALPLIGAEFGLSRTTQGLVVSAFAIAYLIGQLPGGLLADRVGARPLLVISLVAWSVFTAATGFAPGLAVLLVLRALFGVAQALFPGASFKALAERTTQAGRSRGAGLILASNSVGAGLGPLIVAPLVVAAGWRHTFWIVAAAGLIVGIALWKLLPPPLPRALTEPEGLPEPAKVPVSRVFRNGLVIRCALMFAFFNMLAYGMITWVPSYLVEAKGLSLVAAGVSAAIPQLVNAVGVMIGGWLMSRWFDRDARRLVVPALVVAAVLLVPMLLAESATMFTVLQTLAMFFSALASIGIVGLPLRVLPRDLVGSGMGLVNTGGQLAGVLAPLVMGWLADRFGFAAAFGFLAVSTLAAAAISLTTRSQRVRLGDPVPVKDSVA
ncbi:MFS transporter [Amycolatopsis jiangsuensis]|uniref:Putative MFS family arabinose efflux permease n=1 Tax=Amycolatopsis jiangsuensis TaxID=1181879 RepID=A0A840IMC7_9PSEU|nr:MFS transporter [Amycolatopsis jiangsuensis]MBB4683486.1 putative MFS family arabinose efflux permease [Amycolatopsis jiangsuensis]